MPIYRQLAGREDCVVNSCPLILEDTADGSILVRGAVALPDYPRGAGEQVVRLPRELFDQAADALAGGGQ